MGGLTADVRGVSFSKPPLGKQGHDEKSVNDFLQLAVRRLEGRGHNEVAASMAALDGGQSRSLGTMPS